MMNKRYSGEGSIRCSGDGVVEITVGSATEPGGN